MFNYEVEQVMKEHVPTDKAVDNTIDVIGGRY